MMTRDQEIINRKPNTKTFTDENDRDVVTLHQTNIVTFDADSIILNSGGWSTSTTKRRMNFVSETVGLGYHVSSKNWDWQVTYNGETHSYSGDKIKLDRSTGKAITI